MTPPTDIETIRKAERLADLFIKECMGFSAVWAIADGSDAEADDPTLTPSYGRNKFIKYLSETLADHDNAAKACGDEYEALETEKNNLEQELEEAKDIHKELANEISKLWKEVKPSEKAQGIRAKLSTAFDSSKSKGQWLADHAPDYVWDLVDIAAQWSLDNAAKDAHPNTTEGSRLPEGGTSREGGSPAAESSQIATEARRKALEEAAKFIDDHTIVFGCPGSTTDEV